MKRVVIKVLINDPMNLEEFLSKLNLNNGKKYLFIFNTISSSKEFYKLLSASTGEDVVYLSTHLTPKDRLQRIERIKNGTIRLAVTTQLVETGVDIDFDFVYRDLAPLDSLIQATGRCNRNWQSKNGICYLVKLKDERKAYAYYIYDSMLLDITCKILSQRDSIEENLFWEVTNQYYEMVIKRKSGDFSRELLKVLCSLKYNSEDEQVGIADFRLIEEAGQKIDVFIEQDEKTEFLWRNYCKLREIPDVMDRRVEFNKMKADFYRYVISVPLSNLESLPPLIEGFGYVSKSALEDYYDKDTGFKCKAGMIIW